MQINADFGKRVVVRPGDAQWRPSPLPGVERRMLDRIGGEVARATSIVRYAPGSSFSAHQHDGGEEFFVLEGVFSDASGDFAPGCYVRNPPGSEHAPWSRDGCTIFVKLRQFASDDLERVVVDMNTAEWLPGPAPGVATMPLHRHGAETVFLLRFSAGAKVDFGTLAGGQEILVLDGSFGDDDGVYPQESWLRYPPGANCAAISKQGCTVYVKQGHLAQLKHW